MSKAPTYFSATTTEADAKFADEARRASAALELIRHPLAGPSGEPLHVGVARIGPARASAATLVLSGTHGVEGFAGAGIQTGLLSELSALPDQTALLLVHLINPWGPAWNRREDHENIDLFRNFLYLEDPVTPDPLFDVVDDALDLAHFPEHTPEHDARVRDELIARYGSAERLIAAIRRGQHHRPKSMSYHGNHPSWSRTVLQDVLSRHLAGCRRLAVLDIHTGFGQYGEGLVMSYDAPGDPRHERIQRWFERNVYVPGADADIPPHRKSPYGIIADWLPGVAVTAAILEFGTFPPDEYRDVFPANHYYHIYGNPRSEEGLRVGARYRRYFYPEEPSWMNSVWHRGHEATLRMLAGLNGWTKN
ncbi:MAG: DUF2817 domain-containing protein [Steroidobacteraceae bacterium]